MVRLWRRFFALERSRRRLVCEAALLIGLVLMLRARVPFLKVRLVLDRVAALSRSAADDPAATIASVDWAIAAVAARLRSATCLVQALAAGAMLRRRGVSCELRFGIRRSGGGEIPIEGHAWIECANGRVIGRFDDFPEFQPMAEATRP